jgi:hypothetical protein
MFGGLRKAGAWEKQSDVLTYPLGEGQSTCGYNSDALLIFTMIADPEPGHGIALPDSLSTIVERDTDRP